MSAKSGQKGRKIGRGSRSPSSKTYRLAKRWETNAKKRAMRHARVTAKKVIKRISWAIRKGKTTLQAEAARLQELRYTVSQNRTG